MARSFASNPLLAKLAAMNWLLPLLLLLIGAIGVLTIYSASGGNWHMGASRHLVRLLVGLIFMILIALTDIRVWFSMAYPVFLLAVLLLIGVALFGVTINGSQRWLDLGPVRIQPSELMKLASVLALARFYHDLPAWRVSKPVGIFGAGLIVFLPAALILHEPDLGTALMVVATGIVMIFLAGISWRIILMALGLASVAVPAFFLFGLKDYQRERILTFLDPSRDPTGASYHIIQSKIALGSGGVSGKGFMQGTQSALKYVPENRTDFIFTVIGEEFGLVGGLVTMFLYILVIAVCFWLALQVKNVFSRVLIFGIATTFSLYVFINMAMVMGLAPVVGVPLPLISYGGTVMMTVFAGFGMILSAYIHRDVELPRGGGLRL